MRLEDRDLDVSPAEGAQEVVLGLVAEAVEAAGGLAAGRGDAPLHDFRVALRRLRSALRAFGPWLGEAVRRRHLRRLRALARATSGARDAEVQLLWLATVRAELSSPSRLPGYGGLVVHLEARRAAGPQPARIARRLRRVARTLRRRLGRARRRRRAEAIDGGAAFGAALAAVVDEAARALAARVAAIRDAADVEGAHRARIRGKRLRYLLEPLRGTRRADPRAAVRELKALQDVLGDLHDAHVLAAELGAALVEASAERARRVHAAVLAPSPAGGLREPLRGSPRPGLLALVRLVRARRDALFAKLDRARRGGEVEGLAARVRSLARALALPAPGPAPAGPPARARRPAARRRPRRGSAGGARPSRAP